MVPSQGPGAIPLNFSVGSTSELNAQFRQKVTALSPSFDALELESTLRSPQVTAMRSAAAAAPASQRTGIVNDLVRADVSPAPLVNSSASLSEETSAISTSNVAQLSTTPLTPSAAPTPTPSPTTTSAPHAPVPAPIVYPPGTVQEIIVRAARKYGVSGSWMIKIATCESGLNPRSVNAAGPYDGLFQFLPSTFYANGGTNIWSPTQQANITADMLAHGQAGQWGCA